MLGQGHNLRLQGPECLRRNGGVARKEGSRRAQLASTGGYLKRQDPGGLRARTRRRFFLFPPNNPLFYSFRPKQLQPFSSTLKKVKILQAKATTYMCCVPFKCLKSMATWIVIVYTIWAVHQWGAALPMM